MDFLLVSHEESNYCTLNTFSIDREVINITSVVLLNLFLSETTNPRHRIFWVICVFI